MRSQSNCILSKDDVYGYANHWLDAALKLEYEGAKCTASTIVQILLIAASRMASIFAVCRDLADAPSDQTIRNALARALPGITELERRLNRALAAKLPKALFRKSRRIAIDLTLIPYHGQPLIDKKEIYRPPTLRSWAQVGNHPLPRLRHRDGGSPRVSLHARCDPRRAGA